MRERQEAEERIDINDNVSIKNMDAARNGKMGKVVSKEQGMWRVRLETEMGDLEAHSLLLTSDKLVKMTRAGPT